MGLHLPLGSRCIIATSYSSILFSMGLSHLYVVLFIVESFVGNNDDLRGAIERVQEKFRWMESSDDERSSADEDSSALIAVNAENRLMKVENNPIVERFHSREFTGLEPSVPRDLGPEIHEGMFGIARGYKHLSAATDC